MKVIKPAPVSLISRCFEYRGRMRIGVSALVMTTLGETPALLPEKDIWSFWATRPESRGVLEEGMPRTRSEYLVSGAAYPHGPDRNACAVSAQVGALQKRLLVYGMRHWDGDRISGAGDFASLPLDWTHSYGGPACAENPLGMGAQPQLVDGRAIRFLPHIEHPDTRLTAPGQQGTPAGFGPLDCMWPQRASGRGTYDDQWFREQFPAVASDADWRIFNVASADQQQVDPFRGDEAYAFHHMHPAHAVVRGRLARLRARVFVTHREDDNDTFRELGMRLNTLWFFPDADRVIMAFQGVHEIREDDGADIVHLMAALEDLGAARPETHYLAVRDKRLDKATGALESLREEDLMPADRVVPLFDFKPLDGRMFDRLERRAEQERAAARALVVAHGLDPDEGHGPPARLPRPPAVRSLDDLIAVRQHMAAQSAALRKKAEADKATTVASIREWFAQQGSDGALVEREMAGLETRGPPRPFADALIASFKEYIVRGKAGGGDVSELEDMVADDQLIKQWRETEEKQREGYRVSAHLQLAVDPLQGDAAVGRRRSTMERHAAGLGLARCDLTGADLSGLDLRGVDLRGAHLESANLTGTNLAGANLEGAVLAHARLVGTQLQAASLVRANLGATRIEKSHFGGADLSGAIFERAVLNDVSWRGARLDGVRLHEALLASVDCTQARSEALVSFIKRDLRGCCFAGVQFRKSAFIECDLAGVDFTDARMDKCAFVSVTAGGARFAGVAVLSGCFTQGCELAGADFSGARLPSMNFRGSTMVGAGFRGALIDGSDFSECDLDGADFRSADARDARFVRALLHRARFNACNLQNAVFQHARLEDTDFSQANLFQSDFARVRRGPGVGFAGAFTTRIRTLPLHRPEPSHA